MNLLKKKLSRLFNEDFYYHLYINRESRAQFIARLFKKYIKNSLLDIGCGEGFLKQHIPKDVKYIGVDNQVEADFNIDLEKEGLTKFEDKSYYIIVCTDVLEHLDNIHESFDELCRVSQKYIIISLPNAWAQFKFSLLTGVEKLRRYGLPENKPSDRHKWFFNYDEALNFIKERGKRNGYIIRYKFTVPLICNTPKHHFLNLFFKFYLNNKIRYQNLFYSNLWVILERQSNY